MTALGIGGPNAREVLTRAGFAIAGNADLCRLQSISLARH